jgi:hypothetical protein
MGTYRVETPVPDFTGALGSVVFRDGVATVEGRLEFVDGQPVLDEHTSPVEFHHMVRSGYRIVPVDEPVVADVDGDGATEELPKRSASTEAWRAFAVEHGMTQEEADGLSRDELVARYYKETPA